MPLLVVLVGLGSFGLGRMSALEAQNSPISVTQVGVVAAAAAGTLAQAEGGRVVASKTGTKYFLPWCAGAKNISPLNLLTFSSSEEAKAKGYMPAANCKGL